MRQTQWNTIATELASCLCFNPCLQGGDDNMSMSVSQGEERCFSASLHLIVYFAVSYNSSYSAKLVLICNKH